MQHLRPLHLLRDVDRLSPAALRTRLEDDGEAVVVDVRPQNQFDIAHIPGMECTGHQQVLGSAC